MHFTHPYIPQSPFTVTAVIPEVLIKSDTKIAVVRSRAWGLVINKKSQIIVCFENALIGYSIKETEKFVIPHCNHPRHIALGSLDQVYVTDVSKHEVLIYETLKQKPRMLGKPGSDNGEFKEPAGIAVNSLHEIIVVDSGNHRVQVFDSKGRFLFKFGMQGSDNGCFEEPWGVTVDNENSFQVIHT